VQQQVRQNQHTKPIQGHNTHQIACQPIGAKSSDIAACTAGHAHSKPVPTQRPHAHTPQKLTPLSEPNVSCAYSKTTAPLCKQLKGRHTLTHRSPILRCSSVCSRPSRLLTHTPCSDSHPGPTQTPLSEQNSHPLQQRVLQTKQTLNPYPTQSTHAHIPCKPTPWQSQTCHVLTARPLHPCANSQDRHTLTHRS
jgi:hypothetical protein